MHPQRWGFPGCCRSAHRSRQIFKTRSKVLKYLARRAGVNGESGNSGAVRSVGDKWRGRRYVDACFFLPCCFGYIFKVTQHIREIRQCHCQRWIVHSLQEEENDA